MDHDSHKCREEKTEWAGDDQEKDREGDFHAAPGSCHGRGKGLCHGQPQGKSERFTQPTLLLCLAEKSSYGYELLESLSQFPYAVNPDPGAVYRHLRRLEAQGYVESRWETGESGPAKRVYRITPEGREFLNLWVEEIKIRRFALDVFLQRFETL